MKIREATLEEEIERDRLTADAWGEHLSAEDYIHRERLLRRTAFGKTRKTWLGIETNQIVSSCESYETHVWLHSKKILSLGLASVFTEQKFRGNGYASKMLLAVSEELKQQYPAAVYWTGFSEVGAVIYERIGFQTRPAFAWVLPIQSLHGKLGRVQSDIEFLTQTEILDDAKTGKVEWFTPGKKVLSGQEDAIGLSADQTLWLWEREAIYRRAKGRHAPTSHAARLGKSGLLWAIDAKHDLLMVLNAFSESDPATARIEMRHLIHGAILAAANTGADKIEIWEEMPFRDFDFLKDDLGLTWQKHERKDTLPIVMPLQAGTDTSRLKVIPRGAWL